MFERAAMERSPLSPAISAHHWANKSRAALAMFSQCDPFTDTGHYCIWFSHRLLP
jgi:hypothetical protein